MSPIRKLLAAAFFTAVALVGFGASANVTISNTSYYTPTTNTLAVAFPTISPAATPSIGTPELAAISYNTLSSRSVTPPTGWTATCTAASYQGSVVFYTKNYANGDALNPSFTINNGSGATANGALYVFAGASGFGTTFNNAYNPATTFTPPPIFAATVGAMGIGGITTTAASATNSVTNGWTIDANMNETGSFAHGLTMTQFAAPFQNFISIAEQMGYTIGTSTQSGVCQIAVESTTPYFQSITTSGHNTAYALHDAHASLNVRPNQTIWTTAQSVWLSELQSLGIVHARGFDTTYTAAQLAPVATASQSYGVHWSMGVYSVCTSAASVLSEIALAQSLDIIVDRIEPPNEMDTQSFPQSCAAPVGTVSSLLAYMAPTTGYWQQIYNAMQAAYPLITIMGPAFAQEAYYCSAAQQVGTGTCSGPGNMTGIIQTFNSHIYPQQTNYGGTGGGLAHFNCPNTNAPYAQACLGAFALPAGQVGNSNGQYGPWGPWVSTVNQAIVSEYGYTTDVTDNPTSYVTDVTAANYLPRSMMGLYYDGMTGVNWFNSLWGSSGFIGYGIWNQGTTGSSTGDYDCQQAGSPYTAPGCPSNTTPLRTYYALSAMLSQEAAAGLAPFTANNLQINVAGTIYSSQTQDVFPVIVQGSNGQVEVWLAADLLSETPGSGSPNTITPQTVAITVPASYAPNSGYLPSQWCVLPNTYTATASCSTATWTTNALGAWEYDASVGGTMGELTFTSSQIPGATGTGGTGAVIGNNPNPAPGGAQGGGR